MPNINSLGNLNPNLIERIKTQRDLIEKQFPGEVIEAEDLFTTSIFTLFIVDENGKYRGFITTQYYGEGPLTKERIRWESNYDYLHYTFYELTEYPNGALVYESHDLSAYAEPNLERVNSFFQGRLNKTTVFQYVMKKVPDVYGLPNPLHISIFQPFGILSVASRYNPYDLDSPFGQYMESVAGIRLQNLKTLTHEILTGTPGGCNVISVGGTPKVMWDPHHRTKYVTKKGVSHWNSKMLSLEELVVQTPTGERISFDLSEYDPLADKFKVIPPECTFSEQQRHAIREYMKMLDL